MCNHFKCKEKSSQGMEVGGFLDIDNPQPPDHTISQNIPTLYKPTTFTSMLLMVFYIMQI